MNRNLTILGSAILALVHVTTPVMGRRQTFEKLTGERVKTHVRGRDFSQQLCSKDYHTWTIQCEPCPEDPIADVGKMNIELQIDEKKYRIHSIEVAADKRYRQFKLGLHEVPRTPKEMDRDQYPLGERQEVKRERIKNVEYKIRYGPTYFRRALPFIEFLYVHQSWIPSLRTSTGYAHTRMSQGPWTYTIEAFEDCLTRALTTCYRCGGSGFETQRGFFKAACTECGGSGTIGNTQGQDVLKRAKDAKAAFDVKRIAAQHRAELKRVQEAQLKRAQAAQHRPQQSTRNSQELGGR